MNDFVKYLIPLMCIYSPTIAIIAYDCGHDSVNISAVSLVQVGECQIEKIKTRHEYENIQLLQLSEVAIVHTYQCKINVIQSIFQCGMFSHQSLVSGGLSTFIAEISHDECIQIHKQGTYKGVNGRIIVGIKGNSSASFSETVAGDLDENGKCQGVKYTSGSHSWKDVIVVQAITVTITDYQSTVRLEDNKIIIRNNIACPYLDGHCTDPEYGMSFWDMIPTTSCEDTKYDVLWQGKADKITNLNNNTWAKASTIYAVNTEEIIFALEVRKEVTVCRVKGFQSEHPRLIIVPKFANEYLFTKKPTNISV